MLFPEVCDTYVLNNTECVKTELLVVITAILCSVDCMLQSRSWNKTSLTENDNTVYIRNDDPRNSMCRKVNEQYQYAFLK